MNCNCLKEISKVIADEQRFDGRRIIAAEIPTTFYTKKKEKGTELYITSYTEARLSVEGLEEERPYVNVVHSFCPFCGTKTEPKA